MRALWQLEMFLLVEPIERVMGGAAPLRPPPLPAPLAPPPCHGAHLAEEHPKRVARVTKGGEGGCRLGFGPVLAGSSDVLKVHLSRGQVMRH